MTDESRPTPPEPSRRGPKPARFFSSVDASILGLGSQMLSEVVAGVLLGYGLDYMLGTTNRWIVVGSIAGVAVAMVSVFRVALRPQTPRRRNPAERSVTPRAASGSEGAPGSQSETPPTGPSSDSRTSHASEDRSA